MTPQARHDYNPDTHPQDFDRVAEYDKLRAGDVYNDSSMGWIETEYHSVNGGRTPAIMGRAYFRRKPTQQKEPMQEHKYFRLMQVGEKVTPYRYYVARLNESGTPSTEFVPDSYGGTIASEWLPRFHPVQVDEWIEQNVQPVTRADFEPTGYINAIYPGSSSVSTIRQSDMSNEFTHWRRITPPIKVEQPIMIESDGTKREVIVNSDGSVTVGCTTVPASTMNKIENRRKQVSGE